MVVLGGCGDEEDDSNLPEAVTFEFAHGTGPGAPTYRATTSDPDRIAEAREELAKPAGERTKHVGGPIGQGGGSDNAPWNWHFEQDEWVLKEASIELCDGEPSYVSEHLEEWIEDVGQYCPWSARIVRELEGVP
jgi:hypothetical protein